MQVILTQSVTFVIVKTVQCRLNNAKHFKVIDKLQELTNNVFNSDIAIILIMTDR